MSDQQFAPRRAEPKQAFETVAPDGTPLKIRADDEGIVQPKTAQEAALLDLYDLPVARAAQREQQQAASEPIKAAGPDAAGKEA